MALRKILVVTDPPVTGGAILPNGATFTIGDAGHPVASIGDKASCQACGSVGSIVKKGGTRRMNWGDKEVALEGDLLACKCPVKPPIISDKANAQKYDDMGDQAASLDDDCFNKCQHLLGKDPLDQGNPYTS